MPSRRRHTVPFRRECTTRYRWRPLPRPALLDSFERLFDLYRRGTVVPHVAQTYSLAEAGQAIAAIGERRVLGKVVVSVSAEA